MGDSKRLKILSTLLLTLFLSYQAGISLFTHTHTINGMVVVHSHPYTGDNHIHSDAQIYALSHIATFLGEEATTPENLSVEFVIAEKIGVEQNAPHLLSAHTTGACFRAPPFYC